MTLGEAIERFRVHDAENRSSHETSLALLKNYFASDTRLADISAPAMRDFLSRWYVQTACSSNLDDSVPDTHELLDSLTEFCVWADEQADILFEELSPLLIELRHRLPRAIEITGKLSRWLRQSGGAFSFPEFLTSFEEGGHSQYDIDTPGAPGAVDGHFRIKRVQGSLVEAEDILTEERVWPILFPAEAASLLDDEYIINLELVRDSEGWRIVGCGFAYPPGTEL